MAWLFMQYVCPACSHGWQDEWECAVDDICPECGLRAVQPAEWLETE